MNDDNNDDYDFITHGPPLHKESSQFSDNAPSSCAFTFRKKSTTQEAFPEPIDLSSLIPPPNPLPSSVFVVGESNDLLKKTTIKQEVIEPEKVLSQEETNLNPSILETEKEKVYIEEIFSEDSITAYYALEFHNFKYVQNPVVYSRNGRTHSGSSARSEGGISFGMKDLQRHLSPTFKYNLKDNKRFWRFMNGPDRISPYYSLKNSEDDTLIFESRFESGNLDLAIRMSENHYYLILQNDANTRGNTQWFFFKVSNTRKDQKIMFSILNFTKKDSLFNHGMKLLIFSEKKNAEDNTE